MRKRRGGVRLVDTLRWPRSRQLHGQRQRTGGWHTEMIMILDRSTRSYVVSPAPAVRIPRLVLDEPAVTRRVSIPGVLTDRYHVFGEW